MRGVTLVELLAVIVLLGIVGAGFGVFIVPAVNAYHAQAQRAALVDAAESALRRMARDIRIAVPNSVRVTNSADGFVLEVVPTVDGARFCATDGTTPLVPACGTGAAQNLDVAATDAEFDVLGLFQDSGFVASPGDYRLAVGNSGSEIYTDSAAPAPITPAAKTISLSLVPGPPPRHHVTISGGGHQFCTSVACSPRQRVYVVRKSEAPVAYVCSKSAGTLTRYWGYAFSASYTTGANALVAKGVHDCSVQNDGLLSGVVTVLLALKDAAGETVTLLHQVHLDNSQ